MLTAALVAGGIAGFVGVLLHFMFIQDQILLAERYEAGELVHYASGSSPDDPPPAIVADTGSDTGSDAGSDVAAPEAGGHDHAPSAPGEDGPITRNGLTVLFWLLVHAGFGLLLVAGFGLAEAAGRRIGPSEGLIWGIAGYVSFQLAPALGLPPEVPGSIAADITLRLWWWWGTVAATAGGLALIAFVRGPGWPVAAVGAVALMLLPHVLGAPQPDAFWGVVPPEVAATFAARALGVGLAAWAVLGWTAGWLWSRPQSA